MAELIARIGEGRLAGGAGLRRLLGWSIAATGALLLGSQVLAAAATALQSSPALAAGVASSAAAGLATGLGALGVLFLRRLGQRGQDGLLGLSAGVMLAAAVFSLLLPAIDAARALSGSAVRAALMVGAGLLAGGLALWIADRLLPHQHFVKADRPGVAGRSRGLQLIIVALALHNVPEGLAVGAGYAGGEALGLATALGIGLQNMPEGLVVASAMLMLGHGWLPAVGVATLTGLAEPVGALVGGVLAGGSALLLPVTLAFAAGAMLFVISHEMVPESHRSGNEGLATGGLLAGFAAMLVLTGALG